MATRTRLGNGAEVKQRNIFGPVVLTAITLGIYGLWWVYEINRELRDAGEDVNPLLSLLAMFPGFLLIIPPFVMTYRTGERIRNVQGRTSRPASMSPVLNLVLWVLVSAFATIYTQHQLNEAWSATES